MKILFVIKMVETTEPMGIMLLSALAKSKGRENQSFLHVLDNGGFEERLKTLNPNLVAFSAKTGDYKYYLEAAKLVKKFNPKVFTIVGGPHCTFNPQKVIEDGFDAIGVGECDDAWPEFLDKFGKGQNINDIPNILTMENFSELAVKEKGEWKLKNIAPRKTNLDDLPYLDYELFYENTDFIKFSPRRTIMTSRGCPFKCTYCFNRRFNEIYQGKGRLHNRYSVDRICAELKYVKEKWPSTRFIKFYDDVFALRVDDWLKEFAEKYPKEVGLPFLCLTRADVIAEHPDVLYLLKDAGIHSLSMSIESGNDYVRNNILERGMSKEQMIYSFNLAYELGIPTFANTILAIPVEKETEQKEKLPDAVRRDIEGLDLNLECRATFGEFPILFPYPGTKLGEYCVEKGFFNGNFDELHASYQTDSPLSCFTRKEKMIQQNLALLGPVCMFFGGNRKWFLRIITPFIRKLTVGLLIKLPLTKIYFVFYVLVKNYLYKYKIYKTGFSWIEYIMSTFKIFKVDLFKQFGK